jgi:CubicO group peptidase (beta-lactamase class C family)
VPRAPTLLVASVFLGCGGDDGFCAHVLEAAAPPVAVAADAGPADITPRIEAALAGYAARALLSGTVTVGRGTDVIWERAYGGGPDVAELARPRVIASISKVLVRVAVMRALDDGVIASPDDPVSRYLPEIPAANLAQGGVALTIQHLLDHKTCLVDLDETVPGVEWLYFDAGDVVDVHARTPLRSGCTPGTVWDYSNAGHSLLGAVLEHATGRPYPDYLRDVVLSGTGTTTTGCLSEAGAKGVARGHVRIGNAMVENRRYRWYLPPDFDIAPGCLASGGLYSTGRDLVRFFGHLLRGDIVRDTAALLRHRVSFPEHADTHTLAGYRFDHGPLRLVTHGGNYSGSSTNVMVDIDRGITVAVLLDYEKGSLGPDMDGWVRQISTDVHRAINAMTVEGPWQIHPLSAPAAASYAGTYAGEGTAVVVQNRNDAWGITEADAAVVLFPWLVPGGRFGVARTGGKAIGLADDPWFTLPDDNVFTLAGKEIRGFVFPTTHRLDLLYCEPCAPLTLKRIQLHRR